MRLRCLQGVRRNINRKEDTGRESGEEDMMEVATIVYGVASGLIGMVGLVSLAELTVQRRRARESARFDAEAAELLRWWIQGVFTGHGADPKPLMRGRLATFNPNAEAGLER